MGRVRSCSRSPAGQCPHALARPEPDPHSWILFQGALVKGYTAPALPKAAYVHRVDDKAHQVGGGRQGVWRLAGLLASCLASCWGCNGRRLQPGGAALPNRSPSPHRWLAQAALGREARRIVLRWLDAANPAIGGPQALVVLDAERCAWWGGGRRLAVARASRHGVPAALLPAAIAHTPPPHALCCREVFAMSRARVNMRRIQMALVGVRRAQRKLDAIKVGPGGLIDGGD